MIHQFGSFVESCNSAYLFWYVLKDIKQQDHISPIITYESNKSHGIAVAFLVLVFLITLFLGYRTKSVAVNADGTS